MTPTPTAGRMSDTRVNDREGTPWRYTCPVCGSTAVVVRSQNTPSGVRGDYSGKYYCGECTTSLNYVYDKRRGIEVQV